jgi:hypothetical protein
MLSYVFRAVLKAPLIAPRMDQRPIDCDEFRPIALMLAPILIVAYGTT